MSTITLPREQMQAYFREIELLRRQVRALTESKDPGRLQPKVETQDKVHFKLSVEEPRASRLDPARNPGDFVTLDGRVNPGMVEVQAPDPLGDDVAVDVSSRDTYWKRV